MLTKADEGGVKQMLNIADKGEEGGEAIVDEGGWGV